MDGAPDVDLAVVQAFDQLFSDCPFPRALLGTGDVVVSANDSFAEALGRRLEDLVGSELDLSREGSTGQFVVCRDAAGTLSFVPALVSPVGKRARLVLLPGLDQSPTSSGGKATNVATSEFLAGMSHEVRTPLNVVLGFAQVLQLEPLSETQHEAVEHILKAGRHLLAIMDDVLNISRLEGGRVPLSLEPVPLASLFDEALSLVQQLARDRRVAATALPGPAVEVIADRQRLKQVLINLLTNAVKYNREGGALTISASVRAGTVRIQVRDTGIGIALANQPRVFAPFDRNRAGQEHSEIEGTGLGLTLSRSLVEAMGGAIGFDSVEDAGSTFWVDLPEALPMARQASLLATVTPGRREAIRGPRTILFAEVNQANLRALEQMLGSIGNFGLLTAANGRIAIELAIQHRPDLIILDRKLPDMNGEDVLRALQLLPATASIPVVIVTADTSQPTRDSLIGLGAAAYLAKPVDLRHLASILESMPAAN